MNQAEKVYSEFKSWKRKQKFASIELASKANLVENDLRILAYLPREIPTMIELAAKNVAEFREMLNVR